MIDVCDLIDFWMSIFIRKRKRLTFSHFLSFSLFYAHEKKKWEGEREKETRKTEAVAHRKREKWRRNKRTLVITLNVNGYSRPFSNRVAVSRSPYFFFFSSSLWTKRKKNGFSSLACMLVGDYMRVCENKQKDECWRVLSTTRHIEKENVCRFEIGRDKKYCSQCVACRNRREREEEEEISSIHCDVVLEKKFLYFFLL